SFNGALAIANYPLADGRHTLGVFGNAVESLQPQESENYTLGLDWQPEFLPGATLSVNYYNIDYRRKIDRVSVEPLAMLANPAAYGDLFILDPTVEQVLQYIGYAADGQGLIA